MPIVGIQRPNVEGLSHGPVVEDLEELVGAEIFRNQKVGQDAKAKVAQGSLSQGVAVVGLKASLNFHALLALSAVKVPHGTCGKIPIAQTVVTLEVARVLGPAVMVEVGWTAAQKQTDGCELTGDEAGVC